MFRTLQSVFEPLLLALLLFLGASATAKPAQPAVADPALEARVMALAEELRCLVCQNETIAASHAELAVDLRQQIREQLQQGRSSAQIIDFMAERYGDFVLYRPPLKPLTALLWIGPFALLLLGAGGLVWHIRSRRHTAPAELSPEQLQQAQRLLQADSPRLEHRQNT